MPELVDRVRAFNRGWTEVLGLLDDGLLATEHSLAEARVIFELAQRPSWERLGLRRRLGMDASFLTRVLTRLEAKGLAESTPSPTDGRWASSKITRASASVCSVARRPSSSRPRTSVQPRLNARTRSTSSGTVHAPRDK